MVRLLDFCLLPCTHLSKLILADDRGFVSVITVTRSVDVHWGNLLNGGGSDESDVALVLVDVDDETVIVVLREVDSDRARDLTVNADGVEVVVVVDVVGVEGVLLTVCAISDTEGDDVGTGVARRAASVDVNGKKDVFVRVDDVDGTAVEAGVDDEETVDVTSRTSVDDVVDCEDSSVAVVAV